MTDRGRTFQRVALIGYGGILAAGVLAVGYFVGALVAVARGLDGGTLSAEEAATRVRLTAAVLGVLAFVTLGVGVTVAWHAVTLLVRPVRELAGRMRLIGEGAFNERVPEDGVAEARDLARAVNEMATSLAAREQRLTHAERLSSVGTLVAGVAHELNNPLSYLRGNATLLLDDVETALARETRPDERARLAETAVMHRENLDGITRLVEITAALKGVSRAPRRDRAASDVSQLVDGCLIVAHHRVGTRVRITREWRAKRRVKADSAELSQVFLNLIINAAEAMGNAGSLAVSTADEGEHVVVRVRDSGPGIPESFRDQIFGSFATTKPNGTGLGLALSRRIVEAHGGDIAFESRVGEGTTFTVRLPAAE